MKQTKVICLYGGPGISKSTSAAKLYSLMKEKHYDVELVREWVKVWCYQDKLINYCDQLYVTAKQAKAEQDLYGKVDYIITDSPLLISGFYSVKYNQVDVVPVILDIMKHSKENGIEYQHFFLNRNKPYQQNGRYQNEDEAREIDGEMRLFLTNEGINYTMVDNAEDIFKLLFESDYSQIFRGETD